MSSTSGIDKKKIPFVTYYSENNISPVAQDVSDIRKHMERRDSLYRHLGIPSNLVRDKSIIEFGPGSGHNSIHTLHLNPRRYVLVEGNPSGLDSVKELLTPLAGSAQVEFVQSLIEDYRSAQKFDIVLCEGVIPLQLDPENFTKHVASFVNDGGILVITCTDSISLASEVIRKICTALLIDDSLSIEEKIEILLPVFTPHLDTLKGMSRFYRDWILDVLLHDWSGPVYSIAEAVRSLSPEFHAYGFSPSFTTDWRWYKDIFGAAIESHESTVSSYFSNVHNFIDYRISSPPVDESRNKQLIEVCDSLFQLHYAPREKGYNKKYLVDELIIHLEQLVEITGEFSSVTAEGFKDCTKALVAYQNNKQFGDFGSFCALWGRGQQYASFIKKADYLPV